MLYSLKTNEEIYLTLALKFTRLNKYILNLLYYEQTSENIFTYQLLNQNMFLRRWFLSLTFLFLVEFP